MHLDLPQLDILMCQYQLKMLIIIIRTTQKKTKKEMKMDR